MRARAKLVVAAIALGLAAGCSSVTDPTMACQSNPKCKADQHPAPQSQLTPLQVGGSQP